MQLPGLDTVSLYSGFPEAVKRRQQADSAAGNTDGPTARKTVLIYTQVWRSHLQRSHDSFWYYKVVDVFGCFQDLVGRGAGLVEHLRKTGKLILRGIVSEHQP